MLNTSSVFYSVFKYCYRSCSSLFAAYASVRVVDIVVCVNCSFVRVFLPVISIRDATSQTAVWMTKKHRRQRRKNVVIVFFRRVPDDSSVLLVLQQLRSLHSAPLAEPDRSLLMHRLVLLN